MLWIILIFAVYFVMLIAIAVAGMRRMRNMSEYVLGGRRLSSITAALSAGSSTTSAWTMMALPALAFTNGAVEIWVPRRNRYRRLVELDFHSEPVAPVHHCGQRCAHHPRIPGGEVWRSHRNSENSSGIDHHFVRGVLRQFRTGGRRKTDGDYLRPSVRHGNRAHFVRNRLLHPYRRIHGRFPYRCHAGASDAGQSADYGCGSDSLDREPLVANWQTIRPIGSTRSTLPTALP